MAEIQLIRKIVDSIDRNSASVGDWLPKRAVLRFFDYGDNQLRELERNNELVVAKIGRRKFYSAQSIIELLIKNKQ